MKIQPMLLTGSAAAFVMAFVALNNPVQAADTFTEAFTQGKGHIAFRYRLENVDQDSFDEDALASTLRMRLNFKTDDWKGITWKRKALPYKTISPSSGAAGQLCSWRSPR